MASSPNIPRSSKK
jgi:hypothetical protein